MAYSTKLKSLFLFVKGSDNFNLPTAVYVSAVKYRLGEFKLGWRQFNDSAFIFSANINFILENSHQIYKKTNNNSDRKDAEIQTPHTLSQQWKIKSFSRLENGSFSSHSISSAWRSPSVAGCSETEGHNWPWAQTVRWVRTIQPYIISLSQQSKETLTEIKGRIRTGLKGWRLNKCRVWVDGTRQK